MTIPAKAGIQKELDSASSLPIGRQVRNDKKHNYKDK